MEKRLARTRNIVSEAALLFIYFDSEQSLPITMCIERRRSKSSKELELHIFVVAAVFLY